MNLTDMANHVCAKTRKTDEASVAVCKDFLNRAYETLWNEQLWRESVALAQISLTPTVDTLQAAGDILLPVRSFANVIACRLSDRALSVAHYEELMSYDHDVFEDAGDPAAFVLMRPVVHAFSGIESVLTAICSNAADNGVMVSFEYLSVDSAVYQHQLAANATTATELRIDTAAGSYAKEYFNVTKPVTAGTVTIAQRILGEDLIPSNATWGVYLIYSKYDLAPLLTVGKTYRITGTADIRLLNGATTTYLVAPFDFVAESSCYISGAYEKYNTPVEVMVQEVTAGTIATLSSTDTAAKLRQRIRLVEIQDEAETLTVLGKREWQPLTDYSGPVLSWASNCLLDFAMADMLERDRQYSKAQAKRAEAVALLDRARQVQVFQQAFNQRLIPRTEPDYYTDSFGFTGKSYW